MIILEISSVVLSAACLVLLCIFMVKQYKKTVSNDSEQIITNIKNASDSQKELMSSLNQLLLQSVKSSNDTVVGTMSQNNGFQLQQLSDILNRLNNVLSNNDQSMKNAILVIENGLNRLQQDNEKKLEQMRQTVDEKLNVSLENRLTQSFNIINERLESVYEGIGVMKQLATGVGDLKKVLNNVKTRGVWGEISLNNLLEQMLTNEQYASQVNINPQNADRVDFVVKMPGKDDSEIYLPIDAKFPIEDYQRLVDASENGTKDEVDIAVKGIEKRIKEEAKKIKEKYIMIPKTTDFAVMYLPLEGLYSEVLRIPGLCEHLQQEYKVVVCGPTTLSALLNSLQLGFKTLTIQKRSSEVWQLLSVFKQEFAKFVELLAKTQKKLTEASNTIEFATKKSKTIERKLKNVASIGNNNDEELLIDEITEDDEGDKDE